MPLLLLGTFSFCELIAGQIVIQSTEVLVRKEGESVTLNCSYSTGYPSLMWYVQDIRKYLIFILHDQSKPEDIGLKFRQRFSGVVKRTQRSFQLSISNLEVDDSAMYYCLLKHPVTHMPYVRVQEVKD
ncbi:hypothetical protein XELAEV_18007275mg [Xenopus laevis]|uniref:Ig-like domain-containing protein n=1 Tax=Xenopus laevis TaxID=8355 RepID=A0A974E0U8_XENLA|nr:hypothetical protein XELAEV_18007275mg [Xenopus laevis]